MITNVIPFGGTQKNTLPPRVLAVTSGKGGVGKTLISLNLACAMSKQKKKIMIMDADLGLGNIDVMLGLKVRKNLSHVINGEATLNDIVMRGPHQILVVPASSGLAELTTLSLQTHKEVINGFSDLIWPLDYVFIDTAAGISPMVTVYTQAAHDVIMVVTEDPSSLADAYAMMKLMHQSASTNKFYIIPSMVNTELAGKKLFEKLTKIASQFLNIELKFLGSIPFDPLIKKAAMHHQLVVDLEGPSPAKLAFMQIAEKLIHLPRLTVPHGGLEFFLERFYSAKG